MIYSKNDKHRNFQLSFFEMAADRIFFTGVTKMSNFFRICMVLVDNTKLGQMTNLSVIFYMVVSIYKLDEIWNSTQSHALPQSGL